MVFELIGWNWSGPYRNQMTYVTNSKYLSDRCFVHFRVEYLYLTYVRQYIIAQS